MDEGQATETECGNEPACKRPRKHLELDFLSHLDITFQPEAFQECDPANDSPTDSISLSVNCPESTSQHSDNSQKCDRLAPNLDNSDLTHQSIVEPEAPCAPGLIDASCSPIEKLDSVANAAVSTPSQSQLADCDVAIEEKLPSVVPELGSTNLAEDPIVEADPTESDATEAPGETPEERKDSHEEPEAGAALTKSKTEKKHKTANQRKEIRKIISADQLEEETLAAQREESERLQRQRLLQRQQAMNKASQSWTFSMEDVMKRMANKGITMTIADDCPPLSPTHISCGNAGIETVNARIPEKIEHEVFTLSSDDEDSLPTYSESANSFSNASASSSQHRFYSGGVILNNCGGTVTGGLNLAKSESSEILGLENQLVDKGAESDSSDDCVVISPPPLDEQEDGSIEKYDDENNVPDEFGRVLINVGHPPEDPDIFLSSRIAKAVKPHQIGGIRFLYDNVVESMERFNSTGGLGCILAHSMGLGKTIQAAAFCDVFLRHTKGNTVLVIVPINTVQNWLNEFNQWLPASKRVEPNDPGLETPKKQGKRKCKPKLKTLEADEQTSGDPISAHVPDLLPTCEEQPKLDLLPEQVSPPEIPPIPSSRLEGESPDQTPLELETEGRTFGVYVLNETVKTLAARERIISEWTENRGVLLIGYEMYRMLSLKKLKKSNKRDTFKMSSPEEENAKLMKKAQEEVLLSKIYECLVRPGPDLVICDEGHRIKNSGASTSQALKAIRTRRRVVLTGYPLQNNLMEYWCMVDFIRPSYLGTKAEFSNMFERPITNGQCADSTSADKRLMQFRSHVLHSLLEGFVQRRSHLVLQKALPPKQEWVFLLKMTTIQYILYKEFISYLKLLAEMGNSTPNPIKAFAVCCKIWNHPDVLFNVMKKKQSILEDFEGLTEEVEDSKPRRNFSKKPKPVMPPVNDFAHDMNDNNCYPKVPQEEPHIQDEDSFPIFTNFNNYNQMMGPGTSTTRESRVADSLLSLEWAASAFKSYVPGHLENGIKFELLFIIIEECVQVKDKLLVFSQSLLTLDLMQTFFSSKFNWIKGRDYFRLDGSTGGLERERLISEFNSDNCQAHVFLVSTRAGSLGINLIGANRVVVFDASWNPCHDCQAVCRVYRYGQKKECQIYRFVTDCTLEKRIYDRQINKRGMANRVVDEMNPDSHFNSKDMSSTLHLEMDDLDRVQQTRFEHAANNYSDIVMQNLLSKAADKITKEPFEHESLLIDRKEKKLSASERRMAHRNYEFEKKATANQSPDSKSSMNRQQYPPSYYPGFTGQNLPLTNSGSPRINGLDFDSSSSGKYSLYDQGSYSGDYYDKSIASARPIEQHMQYDYREINTPRSPRGVPPLPQDELRRRGLSTQSIVLKRDSYLTDPEGGPDISLNKGEAVQLLRSQKGSYLRLSNGRIIALRRRTQANSFLDETPITQDLTKLQILQVISSLVRPKPSSTPAREQDFLPSPSIQQPFNYERPDLSFRDEGSQFPYHHSMSVPLPPAHPYGDFLNQQNFQISNQRNSSGGDVTIWKKDPVSQKHNTRKALEIDLVPDIEVIKLNPTPTPNIIQKSHGHGNSFNQANFREHLPKDTSFEFNKVAFPSSLPQNRAYQFSHGQQARNNPATVSALLSHFRHRQPGKSNMSHRSLSAPGFNSNEQKGSSLSSTQLPSELTIQALPRNSSGTVQSIETMSEKYFPSQTSWLTRGRSSDSHPIPKNNFTSLHPQHQYFSDDANISDVLDGAHELLAELTHPNPSEALPRFLHGSNREQVLQNHSIRTPDVFPGNSSASSSSLDLGCGIADLSIRGKNFVVDDQLESVNEVMSANGEGVHGFYNEPYENGETGGPIDIRHYGQYYYQNPRIAATESQSYSPQS